MFVWVKTGGYFGNGIWWGDIFTYLGIYLHGFRVVRLVSAWLGLGPLIFSVILASGLGIPYLLAWSKLVMETLVFMVNLDWYLKAAAGLLLLVR